MKRKIKVFSAIASLCLAVALMAFGVYAATQVTYTLSGTVEYEVAGVIADIDVEWYTNDTLLNVTDQAGNVTWNQTAETPALNGYDYNYGSTSDTPSDSIAATFGEYAAIKIVVTVTNYSKTNAINLAGTQIEKVGQDDNLVVQAKTGNATTVPVVPEDETTKAVTLEYYVYLSDVTKSLAEGAGFTLTVNLKK